MVGINSFKAIPLLTDIAGMKYASHRKNDLVRSEIFPVYPSSLTSLEIKFTISNSN